MIGRASSCIAVIAPWLAADAMPTRFSAGLATSATFRNVDVPVTTTSALIDSVSTASADADWTPGTDTERLSTLKLISRYVSSAVPAGTCSNRYAPLASVTAVRSVAPSTGAIITPGSDAPVWSDTTPDTVPVSCADPGEGIDSRRPARIATLQSLPRFRLLISIFRYGRTPRSDCTAHSGSRAPR